MHGEWCELSAATADRINQTRRAGGRVVAVGTTSVRTLESAAQAAPAGQAVAPFMGRTHLFIMPGYTFRMVEGMVTNFHLPRSTLLMLVSAFAGRERILAAYENAKREGYRFYSFGDAMLLI
jgi:S-adenosylmethionine:tRNA ribosyltransferase-isomerase